MPELHISFFINILHTLQIVLQSIRWPQQNEDSNVDSDDDVPSAATVDRVTGFFRTFIEEGIFALRNYAVLQI